MRPPFWEVSAHDRLDLRHLRRAVRRVRGAAGACPICEDERQYVPEAGQRGPPPSSCRPSTATRCARRRGSSGSARAGVRDRAACAAGPFAAGNVLWDCISLIDDGRSPRSRPRRRCAAIAISHPHYYSGMVDGRAPSAACRSTSTRTTGAGYAPDPAIELWDGRTKELGRRADAGALRRPLRRRHGAALGRRGRRPRRAADRRHPPGDAGPHARQLHVQLSEHDPAAGAAVRAIARAVEPFAYDRIYGAWWGRLVRSDAKAVVARSAERYRRALRGELPSGG